MFQNSSSFPKKLDFLVCKVVYIFHDIENLTTEHVNGFRDMNSISGVSLNGMVGSPPEGFNPREATFFICSFKINQRRFLCVDKKGF